LAIQLVGHIAAYSADPAVIKAADIEVLTVCERDNFVASSIQKPKFSSMLDEVAPLARLRWSLFLLDS
jgi:hypothetical protein